MDTTGDGTDSTSNDPTDLSGGGDGGGGTQGGGTVNPSDNPSNNIDAGALLSQLLGTAGAAYTANQQSNASIAAAQAQAATVGASTNPLLFLTSPSGKPYLYGGLLLIAFALVLRK